MRPCVRRIEQYFSSFCGTSGSYSGVNAAFADFPVVAYFSEFGCTSVRPRPWADAAALLSAPTTTVWSGGIAFAYFDVGSAAGRFGMSTVNGNSITTTEEFTNLGTVYAAATPPNTPAQASVAASVYPACPASSADFLASNTLPGTPDQAACGCLQSSLSCQFTPKTANWSAVVGELINVGCSMLGTSGGSCLDIGSDGQTGVYGRLSGCDPSKWLEIFYANMVF